MLSEGVNNGGGTRSDLSGSSDDLQLGPVPVFERDMVQSIDGRNDVREVDGDIDVVLREMELTMGDITPEGENAAKFREKCVKKVVILVRGITDRRTETILQLLHMGFTKLRHLKFEENPVRDAAIKVLTLDPTSETPVDFHTEWPREPARRGLPIVSIDEIFEKAFRQLHRFDRAS